MSEIEKLIEEQVAGKPLGEVDELILDECPCTQLKGITDKYTGLEKLSLIGCGLTTLKGFPSLPVLRKLDVSDNRLADIDLTYLVGCPSLQHLVLSGNEIKDAASLGPLKKLKVLRKIDLINCPVSEVDDYRDNVFKSLEQIIFLDGMDREDEEDEEDSELEDGLGDVGEEGGSDDEDGSSQGVGGPGDDDDEDDDDEDGDEEEHGKGTKRKHQEEEEDV